MAQIKDLTMLQATKLPNSSYEASFKADPYEAAISPAELRRLAATLVASDREHDATELINEGLKEYPDSEDLLAMQALLAEVRQDWPTALTALEKLVKVQGAQTPLETWRHWVRVLRCAGQAEQAHRVVLCALERAPRDVLLVSERLTLESELSLQATRASA